VTAWEFQIFVTQNNSIMKNVHKDILSQLQRVGNFNVKNDELLSIIDELGPIREGIILTVEEMQKAQEVQTKDAGSVKDEKANTKAEMIDVVVRYALRASVKANQAEYETLAEVLDKPVSYYNSVDAQTSIARAKNTRNLIAENRNVLTNIKDEHIVEIDASIKAFGGKKQAPLEQKQEKKTQGTDRLETLAVQGTKWIDLETKLIHSYFNKSHPDLVNEYDTISALIRLGQRHTNALLHLKDDTTGEVVSGALVTCLKNDKIAVMDDNNDYIVENILSGRHEFAIAAQGYQPLKVSMNVQRGTTTELEIKMKPIA